MIFTIAMLTCLILTLGISYYKQERIIKTQKEIIHAQMQLIKSFEGSLDITEQQLLLNCEGIIVFLSHEYLDPIVKSCFEDMVKRNIKFINVRKKINTEKVESDLLKFHY